MNSNINPTVYTLAVHAVLINQVYQLILSTVDHQVGDEAYTAVRDELRDRVIDLEHPCLTKLSEFKFISRGNTV